MKKVFLNCMLLLCALIVGSSNVWGTDVTYTFTSKSWAATSGGSTADWTKGSDGNGFTSGQGIQVTTGTTGANGTSPSSFTNISKIVVTYNTNKSQGVGSIEIKIGENSSKTNNVQYSGDGNGTSSNFTTQFDYATTQTGNVNLKVNTTTNSIWVKSVTITYTEDTRTAVDINSLTFSPDFVVIGGSSATATAGHNTPACTTATFTYESLDTDKATCTSAGVITAVAKGTARIKATMSIPNNDPTYRVGTSTKTVEIEVKKPFHIATFSINGVEANNSFEEETAVSFPDVPSSLGGKVFVGWKVGSGIDGSIDTPVPTTKTSDNMGASDVIYYAVYATESLGDPEFLRYDKISSAQSDWSGTYLIGATYNGGNDSSKKGTFIMTGKDGDNSYGGKEKHTPGNTEKASYEVIIEKLNDNNYTIQLSSSGNYLSWTSGNSLDFVASVSGKNQKWTITGDNPVIANVNDGTRKLEYNGSNPRFACYAGTQTRTDLYKRIENRPVSYSGYCTDIALAYIAHDPDLSFAAYDETGTYWATFSDEDNVTFFPATHNTDKTTEIYTVSVQGGVMSLNALTPEDATISASDVNGYFVPANTGVLIKCSSSSAPYYTVANKYVAPLENNMLYPGKGETIDSPASCKYYLLGYGDAVPTRSTLGFYYGAEGGAAFKARNGGAYLAVPTTTLAPARFLITDEENNATDIKSIEANDKAVKFIQNGQLLILRDGITYDALGRVVK